MKMDRLGELQHQVQTKISVSRPNETVGGSEGYLFGLGTVFWPLFWNLEGSCAQTRVMVSPDTAHIHIVLLYDGDQTLENNSENLKFEQRWRGAFGGHFGSVT